jgi:hypothetical protein
VDKKGVPNELKALPILAIPLLFSFSFSFWQLIVPCDHARDIKTSASGR